ncbi:hypothetical protein CspeluHIS016_0803190 [Cutaneotrichosporon spelunceum]|uniref:Uncharacterized protein n=1 Tax=Cutaneotrichosporon spelunceum TaxID=1672016 RepID=A0AAD3TZD3_9TREE|nr:hypothetical protein CspeluHIS016_0803190 [Cutaneotrichosporon spelunceum]
MYINSLSPSFFPHTIRIMFYFSFTTKHYRSPPSTGNLIPGPPWLQVDADVNIVGRTRTLPPPDSEAQRCWPLILPPPEFCANVYPSPERTPSPALPSGTIPPCPSPLGSEIGTSAQAPSTTNANMDNVVPHKIMEAGSISACISYETQRNMADQGTIHTDTSYLNCRHIISQGTPRRRITANLSPPPPPRVVKPWHARLVLIGPFPSVEEKGLFRFLTNNVGEVQSLISMGDEENSYIACFRTITAEKAVVALADFDIDGEPVIVSPIAEVLKNTIRHELEL